jgi:hypothetical protein
VDLVDLGDSPFADERHPYGVWCLDRHGLLRLLIRAQIPPRRLVSARRALERHTPLFKVQKRIMPVETAEELSDLVGDHCPETPFLVPNRMTPAAALALLRHTSAAFKSSATPELFPLIDRY